jgi:hypothetical protein
MAFALEVSQVFIPRWVLGTSGGRLLRKFAHSKYDALLFVRQTEYSKTFILHSVMDVFLFLFGRGRRERERKKAFLFLFVCFLF